MTEQFDFTTTEQAVVTPGPVVFGEDVRADAKAIVERYPEARSALLPMLHLIQSVDGYVSPNGIDFIAATLDPVSYTHLTLPTNREV